jgi:hypothetical protein
MIVTIAAGLFIAIVAINVLAMVGNAIGDALDRGPYIPTGKPPPPALSIGLAIFFCGGILWGGLTGGYGGLYGLAVLITLAVAIPLTWRLLVAANRRRNIAAGRTKVLIAAGAAKHQGFDKIARRRT